jgi:hypothetical protein
LVVRIVERRPESPVGSRVAARSHRAPAAARSLEVQTEKVFRDAFPTWERGTIDHLMG